MIPLGPVVARQLVAASRETVWHFITGADHRSAWFTELELGAGRAAAVSCGELRGALDVYIRGHVMGFKWAAPEQLPTTVMLTLRTVREGTLVTVTETGFDTLPDGAAALQVAQQRWEDALERLAAADYTTVAVPALYVEHEARLAAEAAEFAMVDPAAPVSDETAASAVAAVTAADDDSTVDSTADSTADSSADSTGGEPEGNAAADAAGAEEVAAATDAAGVEEVIAAAVAGAAENAAAVAGAAENAAAVAGAAENAAAVEAAVVGDGVTATAGLETASVAAVAEDLEDTDGVAEQTAPVGAAAGAASGSVVVAAATADAAGVIAAPEPAAAESDAAESDAAESDTAESDTAAEQAPDAFAALFGANYENSAAAAAPSDTVSHSGQRELPKRKWWKI